MTGRKLSEGETASCAGVKGLHQRQVKVFHPWE
jgi:hypothetical protein